MRDKSTLSPSNRNPWKVNLLVSLKYDPTPFFLRNILVWDASLNASDQSARLYYLSACQNVCYNNEAYSASLAKKEKDRRKPVTVLDAS